MLASESFDLKYTIKVNTNNSRIQDLEYIVPSATNKVYKGAGKLSFAFQCNHCPPKKLKIGFFHAEV